jgi:hypothetical protein
MLSVTYKPLMMRCHFTECRYTDCRGANLPTTSQDRYYLAYICFFYSGAYFTFLPTRLPRSGGEPYSTFLSRVAAFPAKSHLMFLHNERLSFLKEQSFAA